MFLLFQPTNLVKWLQKKNYQYEVTFALYMLTPTEKFIFSMPFRTILLQLCSKTVREANNSSIDSILFLTFSLFTIACVLYLPDHVVTMSRRAYYYFAGDAALFDLPWHAAGSIGCKASRASEAMLGAATELAASAFHAAANTTAAAQEAVNHAAETLGWE